MSFLFSQQVVAKPFTTVEKTGLTLQSTPLSVSSDTNNVGKHTAEQSVVNSSLINTTTTTILGLAESSDSVHNTRTPWGDYKEEAPEMSVMSWVKSQLLPEIPSDFNMSVPRKQRNVNTNLFLSKLVYLIPGLYTPTVAYAKGKSAHVKMGKGKAKGKSKGKSNLTKAMSVKDGTNWSILSGTVPATHIRRSVNNRPYSVIQSVTFGSVLSTSAVATTFGAVGFTLAQIDQVSTFTSLFDQYRIAFVEVWFTPQFATSLNTEYTTVLDFDDATNLGTYGAADDYMNAVTTTLNDGQYRCLVPHVAVAAYSGAFTSFANETAPWIDAASTGVVHYGIKLAAVTAVSATSIVARARFHVQFRNLR